MSGYVKKEIQLAVDRYIELFVEHKKLKEEMDALREIIEPYMEQYEYPHIITSDGRGKVEFTSQERPLLTSRYTAYDVQEISKLLQPSLKKKCVVEVVDKDKLEALCKLGEVPADVLECKVTKLTRGFSAKVLHP